MTTPKLTMATLQWVGGSTVPCICPGTKRPFWVIYREGRETKAIALDYCHRYRSKLHDACEPWDDLEPAPDNDDQWEDEWLFTGWFYPAHPFEDDVFWKFHGEIVAWMALPEA